MQLLEHAHAARDAERDTVAREDHLDVDGGVVRAVEYGDVAVRDAVLPQHANEAQYRLGLGTRVVHVVEARLWRRASAKRA